MCSRHPAPKDTAADRFRRQLPHDVDATDALRHMLTIHVQVSGAGASLAPRIRVRAVVDVANNGC